MTATKQDLLHRKAERAAIEEAFRALDANESPVPEEVSKAWKTVALGEDSSKGQIARDLGMEREDVTLDHEQIRGLRVLSLAEVMTLKTIGPGHPKSSMSSADLLEDILYTAWRDWCLNSLEGGFSSLRARAWTDVRNRAEFSRVRAQRFPRAQKCPTENLSGVEGVEVSSTIASKKVYIDETSQWLAQCNGLVDNLATDIGKHEAAVLSAHSHLDQSRADFDRAKIELDDFDANIERLQEELKAAKHGARKSKSAMKKHEKAIEKHVGALMSKSDKLDNLRQEHAEALENAEGFHNEHLYAKQDLENYQSLEAQEAAAVARKDYEEAARIRDQIVALE